jgi:hypothetical protein
MTIAIIWGLTLVVAFVAGLLVYRNNAKKFKDLEAKAKEQGKSLSDLI